MSRAALLPTWLRRPDRDGQAGTIARTTALRAHFDLIGDFLERHALEPSDVNYALVRAHLAGEPAISAAITALLREHGCLSDAMLSRLADQHERALRPEQLAEMAEQLAGSFAECLRLIAASSQSTDSYRHALGHEAAGLATDPIGAVERLIDLTRQAVETAQAMESELEAAHRETDRLRSNLRRAQRDADRDHLTGLPNRRHFESRLGAIDQRHGAVIALCDIDNFKHVNDRHGHGTGDRVLKFVGRLLRSELGDHALVARYGGEEFIRLFEDGDAAAAAAHVDRARAQLLSRSLARRDDGRAIGSVTFSAGVATMAGDPREAMRRADAALYDAKRDGKNRVVVSAS